MATKNTSFFDGIKPEITRVPKSLASHVMEQSVRKFDTWHELNTQHYKSSFVQVCSMLTSHNDKLSKLMVGEISRILNVV